MPVSVCITQNQEISAEKFLPKVARPNVLTETMVQEIAQY